jgi:lysophospholipase L1-like esterase
MLQRAATFALPFVTLVGAALLSACSGGPVTPEHPRIDLVRDVPAEDWNRLASLRIVFGHQSVGSNILEGVADVSRDVPSIHLNIVESAAARAGDDACLVHFRAGQNAYPATKVDDFVRVVDEARAAPPDVAFLKFCYIDANAQSDVRAIFEHYREALAALRARHPDVTFVHLTMPLRVVQTGWRVHVKNLIGRPIGGYADNAKRNEYNARLRAEYGGKAPLFDLAEIQSTRADGSRVSFSAGGATHFALAPEYTDDGGHLNALGRRVVAERLLVFLAGIARDRARGD